MSEVLPMPVATRCSNCGHTAAELTCRICKQEKNVQPTLPPCRYFPKDDCDCGGRGHCLTAA